MSRAPLRPCPRCTRHVRVDETSCPFTGVRLEASLRLVEPLRPPGARLSRAAWFALGSGAAVSGGRLRDVKNDAFDRVMAEASVEDGGGADGCAPYDYTCQNFPLYGGPPSPAPPTLPEDASFCGPDADSEPILASTFGQECDAAADCVAVGVGDPCYVCQIRCRANAAIRRAAFADWQRAMERTVASTSGVSCNCASPPIACCNAGTCSLTCGSGADAAAGREAGEAGSNSDAADDRASSDAEGGAD